MTFSGPELRSLTTRSSGRMITSSFRPFGNSTGAVLLGRKVELQDVRLGEHGGENQEEHQDHHHVDHRHDVQIVAPLVIAGVIASDEARGLWTSWMEHHTDAVT